MKLIIDTEKKIVEVPSEFKVAYDYQVKANKMLGKESDTLTTMLDLSDYKVVAKQNRTIKDTTNAKTIADYMEGVKDTDKEHYAKYIELRDGHFVNKNGVTMKTSFLTIKKWFYETYPKQNPFNRKK